MDRPILGIIGGTGLLSMAGLRVRQERDVHTPFGDPSSPLILGEIGGRTVAFLARHGMGHHLLPSEVNYRANVYALKTLGVERILSVSACGSLREDFAPGDVVIPDQLFDLTRDRKRTFFGEGLVAHVSVADPFCPDLSRWSAESVRAAGGTARTGGALVTIEGPRFSTRAESDLYRAWGLSIIGMTTCPEAYLAREAEVCYAVMAHVTDYDVWRVSQAPVTVDLVLRVLKSNVELAERSIRQLLDRLPDARPCTCGRALENALVTDPAQIPAETRARLAPLVDRYLPPADPAA